MGGLKIKFNPNNKHRTQLNLSECSSGKIENALDTRNYKFLFRFFYTKMIVQTNYKDYLYKPKKPRQKRQRQVFKYSSSIDEDEFPVCS